jgi:hypothetical protein
VRVAHCSYAARPASIGSKVLVRIFAHRLEIRDRQTQALLRTHTLAERPGTVVLPMDERVFNPSRETRHILKQADAIGVDAARLCQMLFAIEGRVGQRKLWGIVHLADRYPRQMVNAACAQAIDEGVHSYRHVKAITERLVAQALAQLDVAPAAPATPTQAHDLIRNPQEYGELFAMAAVATTPATTPQGDLFA